MTFRLWPLVGPLARRRVPPNFDSDDYSGSDGDSYLSSRINVMKKSEKKSISYMIKRHVTKEMKYNKLYMDIAKRVSEMSYAERLHVGAVVVKDGRIISMGWNGMPTGWDNNCERQQYNSDDPNDDTMETKKEVLHAESNAISKLARSTESGQGAAMYITHMPCLECAKLIHQSGIETVYYGQKYRDDAGLHFLQRSKVPASMIGD